MDIESMDNDELAERISSNRKSAERDKEYREKENKRGRRVAAISIIIILYILGGAEFTGSGNLYVGTVFFERPWVLKLSVVLGLIYSMFLYHLSYSNWWSGFRDWNHQFLRRDKKFTRELDRIKKLVSDNFKKSSTSECLNSSEDEKDVRTYTKFGYDKFTVTAKVIIQKRNEILHTQNVEYPYFLYWWKFWRLIKDHDFFWVRILPWILSYFALLLVCISLIVDFIALLLVYFTPMLDLYAILQCM